jgi:hypothetical protein
MSYSPRWNIFDKIFDLDTRVTVIDDVANSRTLVEIDNTTVATFNADGLTLASGASINEFSTDGTLAGNSDDAVPTEQAVKTYVDNATGGLSLDKIYEGDSYVEVIDDGTNSGYITVVADGVEVTRFDAEASSVRVGKTGDYGRVTVRDEYAILSYGDPDGGGESPAIKAEVAYTSDGEITEGYFAADIGGSVLFKATDSYDGGSPAIYAEVGSENKVLNLQETEQIFGVAGTADLTLEETGDPSAKITTSDAEISLYGGSPNRFEVSFNSDEYIQATPYEQYFGYSGNGNYLQVSTGGGEIAEGIHLYTNSIHVFEATATGSTYVRVDSDTYIELYPSGGEDPPALLMNVGGNEVFDAEVNDGTYIRSTDEENEIHIDEAGNTDSIRMRIGGTTEGTFDSNGLSLKNGTTVNEISTDVTLGDDSDDALATEHAIKTYVDNSLGGVAVDKIYEADSKVEVVDLGFGYITSVVDGVEIGRWDSEQQRTGNEDQSYILVDQTANTIIVSEGQADVATFTEDGLTLENGTNVNEFSTDGTLGDNSDDAVPTEKAVKTYVDNEIAGISSDSISEGDSKVEVVDTGTGYVITEVDGGEVIRTTANATTFYQDITVTGDLFVDGTTFVVHNQEVTTSDNIIVVNQGETGPGVTKGTAGMEVDRGTETNYRFVFAEDTDTFRIGEVGDTQAVATREDSPINLRVPWWNDTEKRFDTAGEAYITIDNVLDEVTVGSGDSYLRVGDDGTAVGYVEIVTDGVQVAYFDPDSSTQRIGKSAAAGRIEISDSDIDGYIGANQYLDISSATQRIGDFDGNGNYLTVTTSQVRLVVGGEAKGSFASNGLTLTTGTNITEFSTDTTLAGNSDNAVPTEKAVKTYVDQATGQVARDIIYENDSKVEVVDDGTNAGYITVVADGVEVTRFDAQESTVRVGKETGAGRIEISDNSIINYVGATSILDISSESVSLGYASSTRISIDSTSNSVSILEDEIEILNITEYGITLSAGTTINEFSIDGTLSGNSDSAVPTEKAVKTYVDGEISGLRNVRTVSSDTTASDGDILLVDTTAGDVNIELIEENNSQITVKKITPDGNDVIVSTSPGLIDGQASKTLDVSYQSYIFVSNGSDFYII